MTVAETCGLLGWAAAEADAVGPYVIRTGDPVPIEETAKRLHRLLGAVEPLVIRHVGIRPGERLFEELAYDYESIVDTRHPGINWIRDDRPDSGYDPEYRLRLDGLLDGLYSLDRAELRRRLFELAR